MHDPYTPVVWALFTNLDAAETLPDLGNHWLNPVW